MLTLFGVDDGLHGHPQVALHVSFLVHYGHLVNERNRVQEIRQVYEAPVKKNEDWVTSIRSKTKIEFREIMLTQTHRPTRRNQGNLS